MSAEYGWIVTIDYLCTLDAVADDIGSDVGTFGPRDISESIKLALQKNEPLTAETITDAQILQMFNEDHEVAAIDLTVATRPGWSERERRDAREHCAKIFNALGWKWRCKDADGEVYYEGRYIGPEDDSMFGPLEDFAKPNAGAIEIEYLNRVTQVWETL